MLFSDYNFSGKRVLLREDFNVPLFDGKISDNTRIIAALPTLRHLINQGAKIGIMSHLGRPKYADLAFSLAPVATELAQLLDFPVTLAGNDFQADLAQTHITLFENVRFLANETSNDEQLAKQMARSCDVFVMDAFASCHRAHASTCGVARYAPVAIAGPLLAQELQAIQRAIEQPQLPVLAIIGGAKISSKLPLLHKLCEVADQVIIGGGMANTCLAALGHEIGKSLYEPTMLALAKDLLAKHAQRILLPVDVVVTDHISEPNKIISTKLSKITPSDYIVDIGPETIHNYQAKLQTMGTIIWNGPVGIFEQAEFANGTKALADTIAKVNSFTIAGGGDTIAAINAFGIAEQLSYISTGGGAFLTALQGSPLPGVEYLQLG